MNKALNIFYWNKRSNFGDFLATKIMTHYGADKLFNIYQKGYEGDYISPIGSVLHFTPREGQHIFGAGFMSPENIGSKNPPKEVITLRGPLSAQIANDLGWPAPKALGDTGLLASRIYPSSSKLFRVGVVLHYAHSVERLPQIPGVIFINPQNELNSVIRDIFSCEKIVSSSLHGLIVAHSFKIPWVRIKVIDHPLGGGDFKFNDFYESAGIEDPAEISCNIKDVKENIFNVLKRCRNLECNNFDMLKKQQIEIEGSFYRSSYFNNILCPII